MNALSPITAQLDEHTRATVSEVARWLGVTDAEFAADAIRRVAQTESEYRAFVQEGVDAADRGDLVSQAAMESWFEERVAARRRG